MRSKMEQFQFLDLVHSQTALKMSWLITINKLGLCPWKDVAKWINWGMNKTLSVNAMNEENLYTVNVEIFAV